MMKAVATAADTAERVSGQQGSVQSLYLEALTLVERLHRRLLDVIKDEFDRRGRADINSVQALLLYNIGDKELTAGELRTRGYYLGSNVSYNLKKLVELGFLDHQRSRVDRRSVRIRLTPQGQEVRASSMRSTRSTSRRWSRWAASRVRSSRPSTSRCIASSGSGPTRSCIVSEFSKGFGQAGPKQDRQASP